MMFSASLKCIDPKACIFLQGMFHSEKLRNRCHPFNAVHVHVNYDAHLKNIKNKITGYDDNKVVGPIIYFSSFRHKVYIKLT